MNRNAVAFSTLHRRSSVASFLVSACVRRPDVINCNKNNGGKTTQYAEPNSGHTQKKKKNVGTKECGRDIGMFSIINDIELPSLPWRQATCDRMRDGGWGMGDRGGKTSARVRGPKTRF